MNAPVLFGTRNDTAIDGLKSTSSLYRVPGGFEIACVHPACPEEDYREPLSWEEACEFLLDSDTVMRIPQRMLAKATKAAPRPPELAALIVPAPAAPRATYTPKELAERWGVTAAVVRSLIMSNKLPGFRVGTRSFRVTAEAVQAYETRKAEGSSLKPAERPKRAYADISRLRASWRAEKRARREADAQKRP